MTRILFWTLLLVFVVASTGGCDSRRDVIPTKTDGKPLEPPKMMGGGKDVGAKKGGEAQ
jgi:hypothetical protein